MIIIALRSEKLEIWLDFEFYVIHVTTPIHRSRGNLAVNLRMLFHAKYHFDPFIVSGPSGWKGERWNCRLDIDGLNNDRRIVPATSWITLACKQQKPSHVQYWYTKEFMFLTPICTCPCSSVVNALGLSGAMSSGPWRAPGGWFKARSGAHSPSTKELFLNSYAHDEQGDNPGHEK